MLISKLREQELLTLSLEKEAECLFFFNGEAVQWLKATIEFFAKFYSYLSTIATLTINYVINYVYVIDLIIIEWVNRFSKLISYQKVRWFFKILQLARAAMEKEKIL